MNQPWLLFIYKVPNEPSARRVYVWRKLRGMGAIPLQDSAWVLPANARTHEKLEWLAGEVREMDGGQASFWEARLADGQDAVLARQFNEQVDLVYREIQKQLEERSTDLAALSKQYQQASQQDYFRSELGRRVRKALIARRDRVK